MSDVWGGSEIVKAELTLTVLQGADRGSVFRDLVPPLTIGREEGNTIQLNDERVSRCHLKIQYDNNQLVLTDLQSTNGTKINGQRRQLRILRYGDLVSIGRSMLLVGTEKQIQEQLGGVAGSCASSTSSQLIDKEDATNDLVVGEDAGQLNVEVDEGSGDDASWSSHDTMEPPKIPANMTPGQAAQFCENLEYMHRRVQDILERAVVDESQDVKVDQNLWKRLIDLQVRLSLMIHETANPE